MPRFVAVTDDQHRDAQVQMEGPKHRVERSFVGPDGLAVRPTRLIKATEGHDLAALRRRFPEPEDLAHALVSGDPEIDLEQVGRRVGTGNQVWIKGNGGVLYSARVLEVVTDPEGEELSREDFVDVEATVDEETPIPWTGRLLPVDAVVKRFAFRRKVQLRHINGLTFDFLRSMAATLHGQQKVLFLGSGPKGADPLIFQRNGSPFRGFLEGRIQGDAFLLVLHLSDLELK